MGLLFPPRSPSLLPAGRRSVTKAVLLGAVLAVWGVAAVGGLAALTVREMTPGQSRAQTLATAPEHFPTGVTTRPSGRWSLVLSLHPKCPCSRATVSQLGRLLAETNGHLDVTVLAVVPPGADASWQAGMLLDAVASLPGVRITFDEGGVQSRRFGAEVSGHAVLFDPAGDRAFAGGITSGRGHEGDNLGQDTIVSLVNGDRSDHGGATPVYGCALRSDNTPGVPTP